jgi:hypothetical protein
MAEPSTDQGQTTSAESSEPHRGGGGNWFLWLLAALAIYVLGIGPAVLLEDKFPATQRFIEPLYIPLATVCEHCEPLGTLFSGTCISGEFASTNPSALSASL